MTPPARAGAAIEILDLVIAAARDSGPAADTIVADYFRSRRYAGSGDRRAVRRLVYAAIRALGERPASGRSALLGLAQVEPDVASLFGLGGHGPEAIAPGEERALAGLSPAWLRARLSPLIDEDELAALLKRAPLDVRINRLAADVDAVGAEIEGAIRPRHGRNALRLPEGTDVSQLPAFRDGRIEVQDVGSQLVVEACSAAPGMVVLDLCAGGGGKTLGLAAAMGGEGRLIACDTDRGRLSRLGPRAARAGAAVETRLLDPKRELEALADLQGEADIVLIDAPCSGTGTWRRNPEARWRLTPQRLDALTKLQARLLDIGSTCVRPGGALVYAVCSLVADEGPGAIAGFLNMRSCWRADAVPIEAGRADGAGCILTPLHDDSDGFFIARLVRPC